MLTFKTTLKIVIYMVLVSHIIFAQDTTLTVTPEGRMGIGTTTPAEKLEIFNGSLRITDGGTGLSLQERPFLFLNHTSQFDNSPDWGGGLIWQKNSQNLFEMFYSHSDSALVFWNSSKGTQLYIGNSGNLWTNGIIESKGAGFRFPDGSMQTTAAATGPVGDGYSLDAADGDPADVVYVNNDGMVGIGTITADARLHVSGSDNTGTTAAMKITSGTQHMLLDGNEIDVMDNSDLYLQNNSAGNVLLNIGGGKTAIGTGTVAADASLMVNGSIRVADDQDIYGVDGIVGYNDLRFYGDANGGPDLRIGGPGYAGFGGGLFSNVALNIRNIDNNTGGQILNVELFDGTNIMQIQADQDFFIVGDFFVNSGTKNFILDHPLDPKNKSLAHNSVESPGLVTFYNGSVVLGADGSAEVDLPDYFEALNTNYHYQLTCVGGYAPVYVKSEISNNQFVIAGGAPGLKVSWQVTAERNDPWAKAHPYEAVIEKTGDEVGRYWYPEGFGESRLKMIGEEQ